MVRKRFKSEQIVAILREIERAGDRQKVVRKHGISDQTYYRWKRKYGGLGVSEIQRIRELEKENRQLIFVYSWATWTFCEPLGLGQESSLRLRLC